MYGSTKRYSARSQIQVLAYTPYMVQNMWNVGSPFCKIFFLLHTAVVEKINQFESETGFNFNFQVKGYFYGLWTKDSGGEQNWSDIFIEK